MTLVLLVVAMVAFLLIKGASMFTPGGMDRLPGMGTRIDQVGGGFLKNPTHYLARSIRIHKDTQDLGNTPVTKLRTGLVLVRVESGANKNLYVHIGHADDPGTGSRVKAVILETPIATMLDDTGAGTVENKAGRGVIHGQVDEAAVIFGTANAPDIDDVKGILDLIEFEANA